MQTMNDVTVYIPERFETERLIARLPQVEDSPAVYEGIEQSRPELERWMGWVSEEKMLSDIERYMRDIRHDFLSRRRLRMLLFRKEDEAFVGSIGLHSIDWDIPSFEIGYWLCTRYGGHGYITEALDGMTNFARNVLHARRIAICCDSLNIKSQRVAERANYPLEAVLHNVYRNREGVLCDDLIYAKTWPD